MEQNLVIEYEPEIKMTTIRVPVVLRDDLKKLKKIEEEPLHKVIRRCIDKSLKK